ncbi:MAG: hypothetical protein RR253_05585, partial [Oscillospiraceae bacterium]
CKKAVLDTSHHLFVLLSASDDLYTTSSTAKDSPYLWAIFGLLIRLRRFSTQYTSVLRLRSYELALVFSLWSFRSVMLCDCADLA